MTTIKKNTKKAEQMLARANYNEGYTLHEVYGNYSRAKENAYNYCLGLCYKENGYNFRIISHNTFSFSVAWEITNPETGEVIATRIETSNNSYYVEIA